jgi:hypothetical protein
MIIVQLKGGFGNQLFQYAAGLSLAIHHKTTLKVDISELIGPDKLLGTQRYFDLQYLKRPPEIATAEEIHRICHKPFYLQYLQKLLPCHQRRIYKEAAFSYDPHFFEAGNDIYLKGYRQSEHYFHNIENIIRDSFRIQESLLGQVSSCASEICSVNSVSIHIRRGDYKKAEAMKIHGLLGKDYYNAAIERMYSLVNDPVFYVFSDDAEWVKHNLSFKSDCVFVSGILTKTHFEDFYLMSCCKHNIIANSSFSWWAAWLNDNKEKKVIAPVNWFNQYTAKTEDLIPAGWIRI